MSHDKLETDPVLALVVELVNENENALFHEHAEEMGADPEDCCDGEKEDHEERYRAAWSSLEASLSSLRATLPRAIEALGTEEIPSSMYLRDLGKDNYREGFAAAIAVLRGLL